MEGLQEQKAESIRHPMSTFSITGPAPGCQQQHLFPLEKNIKMFYINYLPVSLMTASISIILYTQQRQVTVSLKYFFIQ